jgi:hypothetical protein
MSRKRLGALSVTVAIVAVLLCSVSSYGTGTGCEAIKYTAASAVSEDASVFRVSVDAASHNDYGLSYPVTYEFSIPSGLSAAKAYKSSGGVWSELPLKTANDFFNGIEAVRFDFHNHRAYISASFPADKDFFDVMVTNSLDEPQEISFSDICQYYDDRKAVVTSSADDWSGDAEIESAFENWCDALATRQIWTTVGTTYYVNGLVPTWSRIQAKIDNGFVEVANHTRTHTSVPYADWEDELSTFRDELISNLDLPDIQKKGSEEYITAFIEPYGSWSATLSTHLGQYKYLSDRAYADGGGTDFTSWNARYGTYERALFMVEAGSTGTEDLDTLNSAFDAVYAAGGIYHLVSHPLCVSDWTPSGYLSQHLDHIEGKTDVWYVPFGALYMYHYCQEINCPSQPDQPVNVAPADGDAEVTLTPALESSAFENPCPGVAHAASQWQITTVAGDYSNPVFNSGADGEHLTQVEIPAGVLSSDTYYWRVRHQNNSGGWSEWSNETSFDTVNRPPDQPSNARPANGETGISLTPTLRSSAFSDPDPDDTEAASQWQISSGAGDYSSPIYDSSSASVQSGVLDYSNTYYWHVRHQDNHGDWSEWSVETSFTTLVIAPSVTTEAAGAVTTNSARLFGNLSSLGTASTVTVSFVWGTTPGSYPRESAVQVTTTTGTFYFDLGSLSSGTTYYFQAKAVGHGTCSGAEESFTTLTMQPSVTTDAADGVHTAAATLWGRLNSNGTANSVSVSFEWGLTTSYGNETTPELKTGIGDYSADLSGLSPNTTYHFRAKAVGDGTVYGDDMYFTTASAAEPPPEAVPVVTSSETTAPVFSADTTAPLISAVALSDITVSSVTIAWTTDELATSRVEYGLTAEYGLSVEADTSLAINHRLKFSGLEAGKTYHYRVISNDASNNQAVSADDTFTMPAHSGRTLSWAWLLIGIVGAIGLGKTVSSQMERMHEATLLRRLDDTIGRVNLLERERNEGRAKLASLELEVNELRSLICLAEARVADMLQDASAPDSPNVTQPIITPLASGGLEDPLDRCWYQAEFWSSIAEVGLADFRGERRYMAQKSLLQMLEEIASKLKLLEQEKRQADLRIQGLELEVGELGALITLATEKVDEMLKVGTTANMS